jgi:hypothetical protein
MLEKRMLIWAVAMVCGISAGTAELYAQTTTLPLPIVGTASNDTLVGTAGNDVIDGGEGADTMIGLAGDDYYYVDNEYDMVVENPDEGFDSVELKYCFWTNVNNWLHPAAYSMPANVEKIIMGQDEFDVVDLGSDIVVHVYGDPIDWRDLLDDNQFDNASNLVNTCTMASIANVMTMLGSPTSEEEVLAYMLANNLVGIPEKGDTEPANVEVALEDGYGCAVTRTTVRPASEVAGFLQAGHAIILGVDYGIVNETAEPRGKDDHAIALTGVAYNEVSGELEGFYYCDSGDEFNPSSALFMSTNLYYEAHAQYPSAQILVIDSPLKIQHDSFKANGSAGGSFTIIGNSGDNVIWTTNGNDYVAGGAGNDVFHDETGGNDVFLPGAGDDVVHSFSGKDSFVFSDGDGNDEINDTDAEVDELVFDASVDKASMVLAMDGTDLLVVHGSNGVVRVNGYSDGHGFAMRMADGTALDQSGLSNLVAQMEAYCVANGVDFSDPGAVLGDASLAAMMQAGWQQDTNAIGYRVWAAMNGLPHQAQGVAFAPAGDGMGNLLKYAAGLPPLETCASSNLYTYATDAGSQRFKMYYVRSKRANAIFVPEWASSLANGWQTGNLDVALVGETSTTETWEASAPLGQAGFMRLRAVLQE